MCKTGRSWASEAAFGKTGACQPGNLAGKNAPNGGLNCTSDACIVQREPTHGPRDAAKPLQAARRGSRPPLPTAPPAARSSAPTTCRRRPAAPAAAGSPPHGSQQWASSSPSRRGWLSTLLGGSSACSSGGCRQQQRQTSQTSPSPHRREPPPPAAAACRLPPARSPACLARPAPPSRPCAAPLCRAAAASLTWTAWRCPRTSASSRAQSRSRCGLGAASGAEAARPRGAQPGSQPSCMWRWMHGWNAESPCRPLRDPPSRCRRSRPARAAASRAPCAAPSRPTSHPCSPAALSLHPPQDFATLQLDELEKNIAARRNKIFLLMEEVGACGAVVRWRGRRA